MHAQDHEGLPWLWTAPSGPHSPGAPGGALTFTKLELDIQDCGLSF